MKAKAMGLFVLCVLLLAPVLAHAFLAEGDEAPDFSVESIDHQTVGLSDYCDKIVVLFLLETADSRCCTAAPAYEQNVYQPYKDEDVVVLGIDIDPADETFEDLAAFRDEHGLTFPLAMDTNGECWAEYKGDAQGNVPVFYVIDCLGVIRTVRLGYRAGREQYVIDAIEALSPTIELSLNHEQDDMTPYLAGDTMQVSASVSNPCPCLNVLAYIAVGVGDELFFWPSYSKVAEGIFLGMPAGFAISGYPIETVTFNDTFPPGIYTWYAVLLESETGAWVSELDTATWPFGHHSRPPDDRSSLQVPDDLWSYMCSNIGHGAKPLGFATEEMDRFGGHEFRLNAVYDLFRDITEVPRLCGEIGDTLLENHRDPAAIATYCYQLLEYEAQELSAKAPFKQADTAKEQMDMIFDTPEDEANWQTLPQEIQVFVTRIADAMVEGALELETAFDKEFLADSLGVAVGDLDTVSRSSLYDLVTEPWWNYQNADADAFELMHRLDLAQLSAATTAYLSGVVEAIDQLRSWLDEHEIGPTAFETIKFHTSVGSACVLGTGDLRVPGQYSLIVDLGGNDFYDGPNAIPMSFSNPIGTIIDIAGNDKYDGGSGAVKFCCGLFGIGGVFDLSGDDDYSSGQSGLACAWHGSGILVDYDGDDVYSCDSASASWTQAAAHAGLALLIDVAGNDEYLTLPGSGQGFGSTLGFGALVDVSGNDSYHAQGLYDEWWGNYTAMAQGAGFGRRADMDADGRSLAGGIGMLVDGDGDDNYWGPIYVQGTGYWWALGSLEDRAGNDTYRCVQLSLGGTPHMGLACAVDLMGDDEYNVGNEYQVGQNMGSGRDLAFAVFIDGSGNDTYEHRVRSAGAGDIQAMGLFWDRYGDDSYEMANSPYATQSDQSYGACTDRGPMGNFRDEMCTVGVFLDTEGHDALTFHDYGGTCGCPLFEENKQWRHNAGPYLWGYGLDMDWYETPEAPW